MDVEFDNSSSSFTCTVSTSTSSPDIRMAPMQEPLFLPSKSSTILQ
jgi:hypothetical protein